MKAYFFTAILCAAILCAGPHDACGEFALSGGMRCDMFTADLSPDTQGYEITTPLGISWQQQQMLVVLETAYSNANVSVDGDSSTISGFTDTRLSASYAFPQLPLGVILGLDMNLPTGKATLDEHERKAEIGENGDLFEVDDFGEGLNIGPSIGVVKKFGSLSLGGTGA